MSHEGFEADKVALDWTVRMGLVTSTAALSVLVEWKWNEFVV
jgi:hypothetical protein